MAEGKRDWQKLFAQVEEAMKDWRKIHPRVTFTEIEMAVNEEMARVREQKLEDLPLASISTDWLWQRREQPHARRPIRTQTSRHALG